ncbi:MAG: sialidase family protein [Gammaproteobacteria bacterium]
MTVLSRWRRCGAIALAAGVLAACGQGIDVPAEFTRVASPAAAGSTSPHLAVTPAGQAVLSWLEPADGQGHAVRYSVLRGDAWSPAVSVAEDDGWFVNWADVPSVVPITDRHWAAHWLVKRPGGTYAYDIALSISADGGDAWATPLTPHTDGTSTEHGFVTLFPWSGGIGAVWLDGRDMAPDNGGEAPPDESRPGGGMTLRFAQFAFDGGRLDEGEIDNFVCDCCMTDVAMTSRGPVVAYRDRTREEIRDISVARYVGSGWSVPVTVSDDRWKIAGCPVNGPAIDADGERVVVAWYGAPNRKSRVKLAWSDDAGQTFTEPTVVDAAGVRGRVDVVLLPDGSAAVSWVSRSGEEAGVLRTRRVPRTGEAGPVRVVAEGRYSRNAGFPQMVMADGRLVYAWPEPTEPAEVLTAYASIDGS